MTDHLMVPVEDSRPYRTAQLVHLDALAMLNKKAGIWARATKTGLEFGLSPVVMNTGGLMFEGHEDTVGCFISNPMTDADLDEVEAWLHAADAQPDALPAGEVT